VAAVCSEESDEPIPITAGGRLVVAIDPVDGSSNIDVNAPIGTIFAVLPAVDPSQDAGAAFLQPGRRQLAAGMIVYGPSTMLALTLGEGTDLYVRDPRTRDFHLVRRGIELPADSREYAINASNARHWGPGISEYIGDLVTGALGPRERDFNMRWLASLVAETYRILTRGGIFLYPADDRPGYQNGRIRLVYEANPIAFLCEQAGGAATDGVTPVLDLEPDGLHQRVPFVFGSRTKVERVRRYLIEPQTSEDRSPLFSPRGLFRSRPCP
jgi:fructose-1,6-bisphosphatase I